MTLRSVLAISNWQLATERAAWQAWCCHFLGFVKSSRSDNDVVLESGVGDVFFPKAPAEGFFPKICRPLHLHHVHHLHVVHVSYLLDNMYYISFLHIIHNLHHVHVPASFDSTSSTSMLSTSHTWSTSSTHPDAHDLRQMLLWQKDKVAFHHVFKRPTRAISAEDQVLKATA